MLLGAGRAGVRIRADPDSPPGDRDRAIELGVASVLGENVPEFVALKEGRVWRWGDLIFKAYTAAERGFRLRPSPAHREALASGGVAPVPTPPVRMVIEAPSGASLLATEFVDGAGLGEVASDPAAREALAPFIALQHRHGVFHGDPHPGNQLWDGERWWLIDLDGLRGPFRRLGRSRLAVRHWGRLWLNLRLGNHDPDAWMRVALDEYAQLRGLDPEPWAARVEAEVERQLEGRGPRPVGGHR